ncbi:hypothetical protein CapIbe_003576 [Capra ibex]
MHLLRSRKKGQWDGLKQNRRMGRQCEPVSQEDLPCIWKSDLTGSERLKTLEGTQLSENAKGPPIQEPRKHNI